MAHYTEIDEMVDSAGNTVVVSEIGAGGGTPTGQLDGGTPTSDYGGTEPIDGGGV
jgi:hypothetical protein